MVLDLYIIRHVHRQRDVPCNLCPPNPTLRVNHVAMPVFAMYPCPCSMHASWTKITESRGKPWLSRSQYGATIVNILRSTVATTRTPGFYNKVYLSIKSKCNWTR